MKVYHYTNKKGKDAILQDKIIMQSTDTIKDARLGEGVYFTALDPWNNTKDQISMNNYLNTGKARQGYVDWAFEVDIPQHELKHNHLDRRSIYCYPDMDLWLENYTYQVIKV